MEYNQGKNEESKFKKVKENQRKDLKDDNMAKEKPMKTDMVETNEIKN